MNILFFGSSENSTIVKQALAQAGYQFADNLKTADLIIVADYGQKVPTKGLNLHPSLLPKYRGATPVPYQILNGETESGISIIQMTDEFDAGPIVSQEKISIKPGDTTPDLLKRCFTAGAKLLIKILPDYLSGKIKLTPQPIKSTTPYCQRFLKQDGFVSWENCKKSLNVGSLELDRKIRALYPWPGVWTKMPNGKTLKLLPKNLLQLEGKNPITFKQFLAGYKQYLI